MSQIWAESERGMSGERGRAAQGDRAAGAEDQSTQAGQAKGTGRASRGDQAPTNGEGMWDLFVERQFSKVDTLKDSTLAAINVSEIFN